MCDYINKVLKITTPVLLVLLLSACTGSGHYLADISSSDLLKVKNEIKTQRHVAKVYNRSNAKNKALVSRVFKRILNKAQPLCDYTGYTSCYFQVIYDAGNIVNAYASENNKVTIYRGLLQYLRDEEEVAFVIAHEMGHHLANHNEEKTRNAAVGAAFSGIMTAVILAAANQNNINYSAYQQRQDQETIKNMANLGSALGALSYSKEEEREADLLGQYLLVRSGYDPRKAERVVWLLLDLETTGGKNINRSAFGETHPAGPERIAAWRNTIMEINNNPLKLPYKVNERPSSKLKVEGKLKKVHLPTQKPKIITK